MGVRAPQCLLVVLLVVAVIFVFFSRNYRVKISEVRRVRAGLPRVRGLCLVGSGPVRVVELGTMLMIPPSSDARPLYFIAEIVKLCLERDFVALVN